MKNANRAASMTNKEKGADSVFGLDEFRSNYGLSVVDLLHTHRIYVNVVYERGEWYYILYQMPSDEDIEFANSGECQDGDLWLDSNTMNSDWYDIGFKTFEHAMSMGIQAAYKFIDDTTPQSS